ncbi:BQ2448_6859 [Microbotryum intermedium]|uniref:BQ2448_6859 protein n=1 Tax=Microbotryum intermedium TaxID=269621 RepID=A0A238FM37_9BASI|nr:BQ2448_6859 [Microbotryum intermedium]
MEMNSAPPSPTASTCSSSSSSTASTLHEEHEGQTTTLPPSVAAHVVRRLVARELQDVGFDSAQQDALEEIEGFFGSALVLAHDLANHAHRSRPNVKDIVESCRRLGVGSEPELVQEVKRTKHRPSEEWPKLRFQRSTKRRSSPTGPLLGSDDEGEQDEREKKEKEFIKTFNSTPAAIASGIVTGQTIASKRTFDALRNQPGLPALPNKHSFKVTPAYPTPTLSAPFVPPNLTYHPKPQEPSPLALTHLSTLQSRQNDSTQVAASLRNLIRRTSARPQQSTFNNASSAPNGLDGTDLLGNGEELDVVDYSTEWYSSKTASEPIFASSSLNKVGNSTGPGRNKPIWKLKMGTTEIDLSALEDVLMAANGGVAVAGGLRRNTTTGGGGGGGVVKRRRWRV